MFPADADTNANANANANAIAGIEIGRDMEAVWPKKSPAQRPGE